MKKIVSLFLLFSIMLALFATTAVGCSNDSDSYKGSSKTKNSALGISADVQSGKASVDRSPVNDSVSAGMNSGDGGIEAKLVDGGIDYSETLDFIPNPGIGFYYDVSAGELSDDRDGALVGATYDAENPEKQHFDSAFEIWEGDYKDERQSYIHLKFGLKNYSVNMGGEDKPIGKGALASLAATLDNLRASGLTATVRFSYDTEGTVYYDSYDPFSGTCNACEPDSLDVVIYHVGQVAEVLSEYSDCVYAVDAGFFGPWGEMHSTPFGKDDNLVSYYRLVRAWLNGLDESIAVLLRKPKLYLNWYNTEYGTDYTPDNMSAIPENEYDRRIGFFNDGFLTTEDDWGTYYNRSEEITFLTRKNTATPFGGEVEYVADSPYRLGPNAIETFDALGVSYLNYFYNKQTICKNPANNAWKQVAYGIGLDEADVEDDYVGQTYYKYIENRLGYRFVLRESKLSERVEAGGKLRLTGKIENVGFGNVTRKKTVRIVFFDGEKYRYATTDIDARDILSGSVYEYDLSIDLPSDVKRGLCKVYIKITDEKDSFDEIKRQIAFANEGNIFDCDVGANFIGESIIV